MDEGLLVDLVGNGCQQGVVVLGEGLNVGKERSEAILVQEVNGFSGRYFVVQQLLQDVLVLNIEDLGLESEEQLRLIVNRDLILQELKEWSIISFQTESEGSAVLLVLGGKFGS